jgi:hypothetical protein
MTSKAIIQMEEVSIRHPLAAFALEQEKILKKHDDKLHWSNLTWMILLDRLDKERDELLLAIHDGKPVEEIRSECCDIANFAMMIYDNFGGSS